MKELNDLKLKCGKICYGRGKCYICNKGTTKKGFTIHHLYYVNNDVVYNSFPQNDRGRIEYYNELYLQIKKNPKRFAYLCNPCHHSVSLFLRYGDKKFNKLSMLRRMSKPRL